MSSTAPSPSLDAPAWNLDWLTPRRCRLILFLVLAIGFVAHVIYLHHAPIDLAGDEAQYWDWSRNLDLSYYSKGPLVAYIIRASCAIFGDTMPAVRYPALLFSAGTSIVLYLLTRKLFGSEKLALGTTLLFQLMPAMIIGGVLMTIDPPMFFCWALATYLAAIAIFDNRKWMWLAVGFTIGIGFLAKYVELIWFIGAFGFLIFNCNGRGWKSTVAALFIALLFTTPVLLWNHQHNWVSFRHVARQTGATEGLFSRDNIIVFVGGQLLTVGPTLAYMMIVAIICAIGLDKDDPDRPKLLFLLWIGLPLFIVTALISFRTKVQLNWPVPAYFTLFIVTTHFIGKRLKSFATWKPWRGWFWATVITGLVIIPVYHDSSIIYPILTPIAEHRKKGMDEMDPLGRLRGWRVMGDQITRQLKRLGPGAFVMCDDYQQTAEAAFYVQGQPKTYCAGSYSGKRLSQYDMWSDRKLDSTSLMIGKNAVYVGKGTSERFIPGFIAAAFERVETVPIVLVENHGEVVRTFKLLRCYGFKGLQPLPGAMEF